jgi:short-subunit dehydrogenase
MTQGEFKPVVLITGASSGLGRSAAKHLGSQGCRVYGTSRGANHPTPGALPFYPVIIPMDVRDDSSVKAAVDFVLEQEGRIDVTVNNAGLGLSGPVEETTIEEAKAQLETNFFGLHRVCRTVLPTMRRQRSGLIINIGSIGGRVAIPFQGFYSASKAAVALLTEALRMELRPFGVDVVLIEPGDFRTGFTANRLAVGQGGSVYAERCGKAVSVMEKDEQNGADPLELAILLSKIIESGKPGPRYMVGMTSQKLVARLKSILPASVFERIISSYYRI